MKKHNSIANEIRVLGAGYRQILHDGWVHYLLQKDAAGGVGQGARLVEIAMKDKIVVADSVASAAGSRRDSQAAICPRERLPSPRS